VLGGGGEGGADADDDDADDDDEQWDAIVDRFVQFRPLPDMEGSGASAYAPAKSPFAQLVEEAVKVDVDEEIGTEVEANALHSTLAPADLLPAAAAPHGAHAIEQLRVYLEEYLGDRVFLQAYKCLRRVMDEGGSIKEQRARLETVLDTGTAEHFLPLLVQLVRAEDAM